MKTLRALVRRTLLLFAALSSGHFSTIYGQVGENKIPLPIRIQVCGGGHCLIYTLEDGDYKNYTNLTGQVKEVRTLKIGSFTRDSVVLYQADTGSYPLTAVWSGHMTPGEDSVDGTFYFTSWAGKPTQSPPVMPFRINWGKAVEIAEQAEEQAHKSERICRSPEIRYAMQHVEDQQVGSAIGNLVPKYVCDQTGVCTDRMQPTIRQSRPATDGVGYTANVPGSFLCQGNFARGAVHFKSGPNADAASELTIGAMDVILKQFPTFEENFIVRPLGNGRYLLRLIPGFPGLPSYSSEFMYPDN